MLNRIAALFGLAAMLLTPEAGRAADPSGSGQVRFDATVESLKAYEVPEWFQDAKFGIFMHWGPQSIPGVAATWYARWMYEEGSKGYKYHVVTYGHPSKFGYKDICKLFTALKFDQAQADRLVKLYKQAGARYVVPVAVHHDNFDMWDSKYQPRFNSVATSGKDVVGMWRKAVDKAGLRLGVASHVARTYRWFQFSHGSDRTGPLAGVPYDGQDPAYADLYGLKWNDTSFWYEQMSDVGPPEFERQFENRMKDLLDTYHPDLYYTDGGIPFKQAGLNVLAHFYNENPKWNDGKFQAVATIKLDWTPQVAVLNHEFDFPETGQPYFWQTDKSIGEWYWERNRSGEYKNAREVVHTLIDVVSKNGSLLFNVPLTGEGELEPVTGSMLTEMGRTLDIVGEAVFATRPWDVYGEGPKSIHGIAALTPQDIRFTRNKENAVLYATILGWPGDGAAVGIKTLNATRFNLKGLKSMSLVGGSGQLPYSQDAEALRITFPLQAPYESCAYPIKLVFAGPIPTLGAPAAANVGGAGQGLDQESYPPVRLESDAVTVLMSDRATIRGGMNYYAHDGPKSHKRFWVQNWTNPDESFEWTVVAPQKAAYRVDALIAGPPGIRIEIAGPHNKILFRLRDNGWDKIAVSGELDLPKGTSRIMVKALDAASLKFKSLVLIASEDKEKIDKRIKEFRSDPKWMADAGYGLMFQWGGWGYPQHGPQKPWPKMIDDFNVEAFADMCAETGAAYVVWSATWMTYYCPAPIRAIDSILPGRTCSRDLIGELADALNKRGMKMILYYHLGRWWAKGGVSQAGWAKNGISEEDQKFFVDSFCSITTEIGWRYGKKLAGWLIDDGMIFYPAPFEKMGQALKAGNSDRLISYSSYVMPRYTEFQDYHFGEGNEKGNYGAGPKGGNGIIAGGPQKGQQGFACFILDGPDWGIYQPETKIDSPRFSREQMTALVNNARERKLALSFNLLMYEDGSVSPESLDMMKYVRKIIRGK
jgi:alpha-L-fucosidase